MADKSTDLEENNITLFTEEFDNDSVRPIIEFVLKKNLLPDRDRPNYLTLIINSPGGDLESAFALIDIMRGSAIPVRTVGIGLIASCAILTFMAGEKGHRILTPSTSILSHQYAWGSYGKEHELFARVREVELTTQRVMNLYQKCTGMDEQTIRDILLPPHDVWLSAEEAVKYGIADEVRETY